MSPKDFINYLNGAIEIGNITQLNTTTYEVISKKVKEVDNDPTPEGMFCTWLKGLLESAENPEISAKQFSKVTAKLADLKVAPNLGKYPNMEDFPDMLQPYPIQSPGFKSEEHWSDKPQVGNLPAKKRC